MIDIKRFCELGTVPNSHISEAGLELADALVEPAVGGHEQAVPLSEPNHGAGELLDLGGLLIDAV